MRRLRPWEPRFFDDFEQLSQYIVQASVLLRTLVSEFTDVAAAVAVIKDVEHAADRVTHEIIARLHVTFATPFDRHDIHALAIALDDVLDAIEAAAAALHVYRLKRPTVECLTLTDVVVASVASADEAVKCLRGFDAEFYRHAEAVHAHERRADQLLRQTLASLFEVGAEAIEVLRWKEVYETLEGATDRCEDVIDLIEAIMAKEGVDRRGRP